MRNDCQVSRAAFSNVSYSQQILIMQLFYNLYISLLISILQRFKNIFDIESYFAK
jgi:hypothetical protein